MAINKEYVPIDNQPTIKPQTVTGIFTKYIAKTLPLAFDESMSYYECLCALLEYINTKVIPALDNNAAGLLELQEFYEELQNYVNDYFKNLDVQEEINNKLDEMAESGQLTDIIAQYLGLAGMITFDTVADMKLAENLVNGSKCCTLGYRTINDNGNATYKVRTITNDDIIDDVRLIELYDNLLVAELIIENEITPEQCGAYGDGIHDDTNAFKIALEINRPVILKDNAIYNIVKIYTVDIANIVLKANNNSTIKWNITNTSTIANFEGMITDDNPSIADDPNGGNVYLKNITFNGNGDNITSFPNTQNFGILVLKARNNVIVENCKFEKIHCDGINLRGYEICNVKNSIFENIGLYQNADGTRNGLTITRKYPSRVDNQYYALTDSPITKIENCRFSHIADECVRIDGCSNFVFDNNYCEYIGQHIVESGHNTDGTDFVATISNCIGDKIGNCVYAGGADGGGSWVYTGNILVENSKFTDMAYQDNTSAYPRTAHPNIINCYSHLYEKAPNIYVNNCVFNSINSSLTYILNEKMICGKNLYINNSKFNYYSLNPSIALFEGININVENIDVNITNSIGNLCLIHALNNGSVNLKNSKFKFPYFKVLGYIQNSDINVENCEFYETTSIVDVSDYTYLFRIENNTDKKFNFNMINSIVSNAVDDSCKNIYIFSTTDGGNTNNLKVCRLVGNYYNMTNSWGKAYITLTTPDMKFLLNVNNNKYNAS